MLAQIEAETQDALDDLRDLARGIYPPLLADKGLAAALEAQARKSPIPVTVDADGVERLPQEIEAAVYFSVLEALQNIAKYAQATSASVSFERSNGRAAVQVHDDGRGFDPSETGYGTGLQGIADRLGALDGTARGRERSGDGATLSGSVPVGGVDDRARRSPRDVALVRSRGVHRDRGRRYRARRANDEPWGRRCRTSSRSRCSGRSAR